MIVFDTDHASILKMPASSRRDRLVSRMALSTDQNFVMNIVTVEEQMRGWMAEIARERTATRQVSAYRELANLFVFFGKFPMVLFDDAAATHFDRLRRSAKRVKTMDLKIACCAIAADALLLTANRRDFERVPGLRFENWLD